MPVAWAPYARAFVQEAVTFTTSDGYRLEGRLATPADPGLVAVVCHPHPLMEGSMSSLLVPTIQRALAAADVAALRFNFRGVGRSEGRFDNGRGEQKDVLAAVSLLRERWPGVPVAVCGWSFGARVSLAAVAGDPDVVAYVAVAPPAGDQSEKAKELGLDPVIVEPAAERVESWDARRMVVIGTEDQISRVEDVRSWALQAMGPETEVQVVEGADHVFNGLHHDLAERVVRFVTA